MKILFICKGNVARSQIAEALFKKKFGDKYEVFSAGTEISGPEQPLGELNPKIIDVFSVMNEEGIDLSTACRKQLTELMVNNADKVVVIMEDIEELPDYLLQSSKMERWSIADPKGKGLDFTRNVKNKIKEKIELFEI
jgi:arsenate reductase